MATLYDRVKVATATVGTGAITLGAPERSTLDGDFLSFAEAGVANGAAVPYWIIDGNSFAKGEGIYTAAGTTLARDANEQWWNGSALATGKLPLSGQAKVSISPRAADILTALPTNVAKKDTANEYTKAQWVKPVSHSPASGSTLTLDLSASNVFTINLSGPITLANPANPLDFKGQKITLLFSGAQTVTFGSFWKFDATLGFASQTVTLPSGIMLEAMPYGANVIAIWSTWVSP